MRITQAKLKNGSILTFGDFNVFIGGNGVGKTTLLIELFDKSTNSPKNKYYWMSDEILYESLRVKDDLSLLKLSLSRKHEGINYFFFSQASKDLNGSVVLDTNLQFTSIDMERMDAVIESTIFNELRYRRPFISLSSCEARLGLTNEVAMTPLDQPPNDPLNVLFRNKKLSEKIDKIVFERFQYHFILLNHTGVKLEIGLSKQSSPKFNVNADNLQDEYQKVDEWKNQNFIPITEAGHGIRSMIRLLTSLLEPVNQIIMIDEPEMHLYPSQKRWLGKHLVKLAKNQNKQVFLVTHDPMILQGILDASTKTNIFRVEREEDSQIGQVKCCGLNKVSDMSAIRNQDQYLQGLFYQRCIVVEGASDRSFYQNLFDDNEIISDKDLGFISAGGKGNTKHIASIASKVGLNTAFIYDFDVLLYDQHLIAEVFQILGGETSILDPIKNLLLSDPTVSNAPNRKEKERATQELCGYSREKGLTSEWGQKNKTIFLTAMEQLTEKGIFIVPNGSLESWAPNIVEKVRFAEYAPEIIRQDSGLKSQFDVFTSKILKYLKIE